MLSKARQIAGTLRFVTRHPLNRGRRVPALVSYLRWQIGSRLVPGPVVHDWVNGSKIIVRPGETGLTGNIFCGLHEFADMAYLLHVTTPADVFVDVGANAGSYTVLACAAKGASGCCVEPVPATFERLMDNIRINNLAGRVEALNLGVSDEPGELLFTSTEDCTNHVIADAESAADAVRVQVLPLDTVLKGRAASVLKIDVEGFEARVLAGAEATLANPSLHSVIMELNGSGARYGFNEDQIHQTMIRHGFASYRYEPFSRQLEALGGQGSLSGNTLFVRDVQLARERTKASPPVAVGGLWL